MTELELSASSLGPVLVALVNRVPGASHAVLASVEGVPIAVSNGLPEQRAEQLASVGAGLLSIADGAGRCMDAGAPQQAIVEMAAGVLMATPVSTELSLTVLAVSDCDREQLGFEVAEFIDHVGPLLSS
ncbi:dynein regulation protein LC7 [Actinocatenispora thailandica]|uniref:Dynein regulation protein LC7 n=1 Tax=Actinocatenispora thailandica TaxID=227318 RepID=A0A7R7DK89_9ACTN|nr:roadblock/LC7 domain-containing protein [Actinocatenispora thailandica]BCJ33116.1 dynein regulation protein LC7 [Actinocatenispora thailandica]